jgi:hypothetical protein
MTLPRISLAAVLACGALALFAGQSEHGPDVLVNDPKLARTYEDPVAEVPGLPAPLPAESTPPVVESSPLPADSAPIPVGSPSPEVNSPPPAGSPAPDAETPPPPVQAASIAGQLIPPPMVGPQRYFLPGPEQWENARTIVDVVRGRGLPLYAAVIALATAMQESSLENLTEAVDYDSLGLFQQRPSAGWGDSEQLTDPVYAAGAFLDALLDRVPDYAALPLWEAAQRTQASAFPDRYAQWEDQAMQMVSAIAAE